MNASHRLLPSFSILTALLLGSTALTSAEPTSEPSLSAGDQQAESSQNQKGTQDVHHSRKLETTRTDEEIAKSIRDELWWSWSVNSDDILIDVTDGVATLSGKVKSRSEIQAAVENAREAGARRVINQLRLEKD